MRVLRLCCSRSPTRPARAGSIADQVVERTLANGFKMLLLEDHKAPVAVVQVWYRVGSRNECPARPGSRTSSST